ncbi:hypothetical protein [Tomitella cavernea]|uniref:Photolyase/cryptochrome alpha/beta domain-containing protein n=1 Tax=Tomitella cavernea TaxID=1387982 RepID=A0ABP9CS68_9ACTN|nr:hypothetical protein [Tomitella cavernea]
MTTCAIIWYRRDLRLADLPVILAAADSADTALVMTLVEIPQLCSPKFPSLGRSVA